MNNNLRPGLSGQTSLIVDNQHLASTVGSGLVSVFSTAMLIGGMEATAVKTIQPYLDAGKTTVGVHVDVAHKAATPLGMKVTFKATLEEILKNGRCFIFHVEAYDEVGLIGEGKHTRILVDQAEFEKRTEEKKIAKMESLQG